MLDKLAAAVKQLLSDNREFSTRIERLEKVKPVVVNGKDGAPGRDAPTIDEVVEAVIAQIPTPKDGVSPDPKAIVNDVLAQMPKPRDGRDAPVVNVSDVASIVLAKIPKPKDGKDGRNGPDLETVVRKVKAQVPDGKPGQQGKPGPQGKPGKDGVSVTKVELERNKLFVWLDGVKKLVGEIKVPTPTAPFNPGGSGALISPSEVRKTRPVYGTMAITQADVNDTNPENTITVAAHPSGSDVMNPPAAPVTAGPGPFGGYYKVPGYVQEGAAKEIEFGDSEIIVQNDGVFIIPVGWGNFRHSLNNASVVFVLGIERDGQILFSQRPTGGLKPNGDKLGNVSGGGQSNLKKGDKVSVWVASDIAGTITLGNSNVTIHMLEDTTF